MPQLLALFGQGLDQGRVAVAQRVHGDAGGKVQVTSAVRRVEIVAFSAFEHDVLATVRRHHSRNHWTLPEKNNPLCGAGAGTILSASGCVNLAQLSRVVVIFLSPARGRG